MTPTFDVVELETQGTLLAGSALGSIIDDPFSGDAGVHELQDFENLFGTSSNDDLMKMLLP